MLSFYTKFYGRIILFWYGHVASRKEESLKHINPTPPLPRLFFAADILNSWSYKKNVSIHGVGPHFFRSNKFKWIRKSTVKVKLKEWYARPLFRIRIFWEIHFFFFFFFFCLPGIFGWGCLSMLRAYSGRILTFSVLMNGGMPCHGNSVYHSFIFFSLFSQSLNWIFRRKFERVVI